MKTYPAMNNEIVNLLREGGEKYELYAAARIEELEQQRDKLLEAGKALVERWDTPNWKDATHTGEFIAALRNVIAEIEAGK